MTTCRVHNCDELRVPRSAYCRTHYANERVNGTPFVAAKGPAMGHGYGCAVCGGSMPATRAGEGTCSTSCTYRRALAKGRS